MNREHYLPHWTRLHATNSQVLLDLSKLHDVDLSPSEIMRPNSTIRIRCARLRGEEVLVSDLLWNQGNATRPLYTVETGHRVLRPSQAYERISAQGLSCDPKSISLVLLHQLLGQTAMVLDRIDQKLTVSMKWLREFQLSVGTNSARGAEDLTDVDNYLLELREPLSFVMKSLDDLENAARQLRRGDIGSSSQDLGNVDELVAEIEGVQRRAHFALERQRFQRRAAGETVAMNDLNVTKVFSVLWAAFIPGTALINWYGQNFRVMPGLSWDGSLWTQLLAVLVLTTVPVLMVKQSGALR